MRLTQCNNANIMALIENHWQSGKLPRLHNGKQFAKKGIHLVKNEFTSAKGKFADNLIENLCSNKIMNYLTNKDRSDLRAKCDLSSYKIKSYKFLIGKLKEDYQFLLCLIKMRNTYF